MATAANTESVVAGAASASSLVSAVAAAEAPLLQLEEARGRLLVQEATDYAAAAGLLITPKDVALLHGRARRYVTAPLSLLPTPFPRAAFMVCSLWWGRVCAPHNRLRDPSPIAMPFRSSGGFGQPASPQSACEHTALLLRVEHDSLL